MVECAASPEDIDKAIIHGWGYRFPVTGILEFIDSGGLDILHHGGRSVARALNRPDLNSPALIGEKYAKGEFGTKTLKGLFDYGIKNDDGQIASAIISGGIVSLENFVKLSAR